MLGPEDSLWFLQDLRTVVGRLRVTQTLSLAGPRASTLLPVLACSFDACSRLTSTAQRGSGARSADFINELNAHPTTLALGLHQMG